MEPNSDSSRKTPDKKAAQPSNNAIWYVIATVVSLFLVLSLFRSTGDEELSLVSFTAIAINSITGNVNGSVPMVSE